MGVSFQGCASVGKPVDMPSLAEKFAFLEYIHPLGQFVYQDAVIRAGGYHLKSIVSHTRGSAHLYSRNRALKRVSGRRNC